MAKKKRNQPQQEQPQPAAPAPPPVRAEPEKDVSTAQIWIFWGVVALAVILARVLNFALPGVAESLIERWIMAAFAVFLVIFLIKIK